MKIALVYLISFAAGPAMFWVLARQRPTRGYFMALCAFAVGLLAMGWAVPRLIAPDAQASPYPDLAVLLLLWVAWIVVIALCTLAARSRLPQGTARRWAFALGAMATTLPWFGLYTAQILAS